MQDTSGIRGAVPVWSVASVALLLVGDVVLSRSYGGEALAVLAGAAVVASVALADRALFIAAWVGAGASLAMSAWVARLDGSRASWDALPGMAEIGGLCLLTCWGIRTLSTRRAAAVTCLTGAALVGTWARGPERSYEPLFALAVVLPFAVAVGVGLYLRRLDRERLRSEDLVRYDERLTISRELHDVVAHHVTGMVVQAQAAILVWDDQPDRARIAVQDIEVAGGEAMDAMRRLVAGLREGGDHEAGPVAPVAAAADLEELAERSAMLGLPVRLHLDVMADRLPDAIGASVYRIVQEAVTNAQRHAAGATFVDVRVASIGGAGTDASVVVVDVDDDGRGAALPRGEWRGHGVLGMTERAEALGGRFHSGPSPGGGWSVHAELPVGSR